MDKQQGEAVSATSAVLAAVSGLIILILHTFRGVRWLLNRALNALSRPKSEADAGRSIVVTSEVMTALVEGVSRDFSAYEPSMHRVVQFPGLGYLTLWGFRGRGTVRRQLVLFEPSLIEAFGTMRIPLPEATWAPGAQLDQIEDMTILEAVELLQQAAISVPSSKGDTVTIPAPVRVAELVAPPAPAASGRSAPAQPEQQQVAAKPYVGHASQVLARTVGRLEYMGICKRTFADKPAAQQYAADIQTGDRGVARVWGADVERALQACGAQIGDYVQIDFTGESTLPGRDGQQWSKKHFVAKVIG